MTREEAITILKAFMENPLFSDEHKNAFNIAIHDIKQRHEWNINNLMLVSKSEWEHDHEILKAYSDGANEVLDKIRAEILRISSYNGFELGCVKDGYRIAMVNVLNIIDKYKAESEE